MKYTMEQIEALAVKLRDLPPVDKSKKEYSMQETIKILTQEIKLLQKRGYTLDQIVESLRGEGFTLTTPTLKTYLNQSKRKSIAKTKKTTTVKITGENIGEKSESSINGEKSVKMRVDTPSDSDGIAAETPPGDFVVRPDTPNI